MRLSLCIPSVCPPPRHSNHPVDGLFVPSALRCQSSDFATSENTPSVVPKKPSALLFHIPCQIPNFVSGIHSVHGIRRDLIRQHNFTKWDKLLRRFLADAVSRKVSSDTTFLTPGQDGTCVFHQPRQEWRVFSEFFLRAAFKVAFDCSDDSTYQYDCVHDEPVRWLVSCHCVLFVRLLLCTFLPRDF